MNAIHAVDETERVIRFKYENEHQHYNTRYLVPALKSLKNLLQLYYFVHLLSSTENKTQGYISEVK